MPPREIPIIAVTMGDPAGIGPEVIVGAWGDAMLHRSTRPVVVGHPEIMRRATLLLNPELRVVSIESLAALPAASDPNVIHCLRACDDDVLDVSPGRIDARAGEAAYLAVRRAAQLALDGHVDAIVTAPLSKAALHAAGHRYPGHTELLAEMCGVKDFAMMLYLHRQSSSNDECRMPNDEAGHSSFGIRHSSFSALGVVHVTLHQSLRSIFDDLKVPAIIAKCRLVDGVMRRLGVAMPRIGVCALNPHAGEDGLFGDEERTIIVPAVEEARRAGLDASGPFPADTLIARAAGGEFDAVVAMYHDQGHIAIKLLGMHDAVNITLGLPIVRTSVAHGTAFDRAWQGTARSEGMVAAIQAAARLAESESAGGR
jgi:4-hydroxythreonine-4-phosphate dehydrogenase